MKINRIDHIVFTVADIEKTIEFYTEILGFKCEEFGNGRRALTFGNQKINLHEKGREYEPKAETPTCGAIDLCFIAETKVEEIVSELLQKSIPIVEGIVERTGAAGKIKSVYFRDPDANLIEVSNYIYALKSQPLTGFSLQA